MYEVRRHGKKFKIFERKTKKYLATCQNKSDAQELVEKLATTGFQGETPAFFTSGGLVNYKSEKS